MIIVGKSIRTLKGRMATTKSGESVIIGKPLVPSLMPTLIKIGFPKNANVNDAVLPKAIGPVTFFNAEGGEIIHKDRKKETAYRQADWTWEQWNGPYYTETQSKIVDIPYKRYPRTKIPPPGIELHIAVTADGQRVLVGPPMKYSGEEDSGIIHCVNLFLEIFGDCEVFTEKLARIIKAPLRRLNWRILPAGKRPWAELKKEIDKVIKQAAPGNQPVIEYRFETLNSYGPDFVAVGEAGFAGYVVFGFPTNRIFVFESIYTGNATYFFGSKWEALSKMTKTQVLDDNLHHARIIHREGWPSNLRAELKKYGVVKTSN